MKLKGLQIALSISLIFSLTTAAPVLSQEPQSKIAIAYDIGFLGDNSFNDAVNIALGAAKKKYRLVEPFIREVPTNGTALDRLTRLRFLAQSGYTLVIAVGAGYRETVRRVSIEYPEIQFAIINDLSLGQMNISNIYYREDQSAYVAGVIAAANSKRKVIGFIGSEPELLENFIKGARAISKKIKVINISYPDEASNFDALLRQIDIGYSTWDGDATVITTVLERHAKRIKLILETPDQYFANLAIARGIVLATVNKNINKSVNQLVAAALQDRALIDVVDEVNGVYGREYGLKNNGIGYTLHQNLSSAVKRQIATAIKDFSQKQIKKQG